MSPTLGVMPEDMSHACAKRRVGIEGCPDEHSLVRERHTESEIIVGLWLRGLELCLLHPARSLATEDKGDTEGPGGVGIAYDGQVAADRHRPSEVVVEVAPAAPQLPDLALAPGIDRQEERQRYRRCTAGSSAAPLRRSDPPGHAPFDEAGHGLLARLEAERPISGGRY
jgi:hypothetical protein